MPALKQAGGNQTDADRPRGDTEAAWIRPGVGGEGVQKTRGSCFKCIKI